MARLLILSFDHASTGDPEKDAAKRWRKGHVVSVEGDSHVWKQKARPPKFWHIDLPRVAKEEVEHLIDSEFYLDAEGLHHIAVHRKVKADLGSLHEPIPDGVLDVPEIYASIDREIIESRLERIGHASLTVQDLSDYWVPGND